MEMPGENLANLTVLVLLALLVVILLSMAIRIVPEYQRLVMFRLGRVIGALGPGLVLMIPFVDRGVRVDLRERFLDVPPQTCITQDNASLSIDFLIYMRIGEPRPSEGCEGAGECGAAARARPARRAACGRARAPARLPSCAPRVSRWHWTR